MSSSILCISHTNKAPARKAPCTKIAVALQSWPVQQSCGRLRSCHCRCSPSLFRSCEGFSFPVALTYTVHQERQRATLISASCLWLHADRKLLHCPLLQVTFIWEIHRSLMSCPAPDLEEMLIIPKHSFHPLPTTSACQSFLLDPNGFVASAAIGDHTCSCTVPHAQWQPEVYGPSHLWLAD